MSMANKNNSNIVISGIDCTIGICMYNCMFCMRIVLKNYSQINFRN